MVIDDYSVNNIYALKGKHYHYLYLYVISVLLISLFIIFFFLKFSVSKTYTGIYSCNKSSCIISSYLTLDDIYNLNSNWQIVINDNIYDLEITKFGEYEQYNNISMQNVEITVESQEYYNNQTIAYEIIMDKQNLWQIIIQALKGGDENDDE